MQYARAFAALLVLVSSLSSVSEARTETSKRIRRGDDAGLRTATITAPGDIGISSTVKVDGKELRAPSALLDSSSSPRSAQGNRLTIFGAPGAPAKAVGDVAFVGVFGFGVDPQDDSNTYHHDDPEKIESWRSSCERMKMKCKVLSDIYSDKFAQKYGSEHVSFTQMRPVVNGTFLNNDLANLTTSDYRFMELLRYLKSEEGSGVEYVLLTDASDVWFHKDPMKLMRAMDGAMGTHYVFGQDEYRPRLPMSKNEPEFTAMHRTQKYWKQCFGEPMPEAFTADKFYNCAIFGGHRSVVVPFLERMYYWYTQVPVDKRFLMCDMFVFGRVAMEEYQDHIITGYPFHGKFKVADKDGISAIYHKAPLPNENAKGSKPVLSQSSEGDSLIQHGAA
jgi:hypothetical protein